MLENQREAFSQWETIDDIDFVNQVDYLKQVVKAIGLNPNQVAHVIDDLREKQKFLAEPEQEEEVKNLEEVKEGSFNLVEELPPELIVNALLFLDPYSLYAVRQVNKNLRQLGKSKVLRREIGKLAERVFLKSEIISVSSLNFYKQFKNSIHLFFRRPRVKYRGYYVCETVYFREGLSQNSDINPRFKVRFFKFIRFYPNGIVAIYQKNKKSQQETKALEIDVNEMNAPIEPGIKLGTWLIRDDVLEVSVKSAMNQYAYRFRIQDLKQEDQTSTSGVNSSLYLEKFSWVKRVYHLTPLGVIDDVVLNDIKLHPRQRPFEFKKVKSYRNALLSYEWIGALL